MVAEIALSVVLLASAGLLVKSLARLGSQQTSLVTEEVLAFDLAVPEHPYESPDSIRAFQDRMRVPGGGSALGLVMAVRQDFTSASRTAARLPAV